MQWGGGTRVSIYMDKMEYDDQLRLCVNSFFFFVMSSILSQRMVSSHTNLLAFSPDDDDEAELSMVLGILLSFSTDAFVW
jgi:hypothetical protein